MLAKYKKHLEKMEMILEAMEVEFLYLINDMRNEAPDLAGHVSPAVVRLEVARLQLGEASSMLRSTLHEKAVLKTMSRF